MSESTTALPSSFEPFSLFIEANSMEGHNRGPRFIQVRVDHAFLAKVLRRHEICNLESVSVCTERLAPSDWDRAPQAADGVDDGVLPFAPVTSWQMHVDVNEFHFEGFSAGPKISWSWMVNTDGLVAHAAGSATMPGGFSRIGGILIYADEDTGSAKFEELLRRCRPEVAAAALAAEMAERIAAQESDASNPLTPLRRRMGA